MAAKDPLDSFEISLVPDEGEGGFHIKNPRAQPFQRSTIHQELGSVTVKCTQEDIIHGKWASDEEYYASLIVLAFRFDSRRTGRRIKWARITVIFFGATEDDDPPEVVDISLNNNYSLVPSEQTETIMSGIEGTAGATVLGANLSLHKTYQKTLSRQVSDATHVSGSINLIDVDYDPANAAEWTLRENDTLKTGVPVRLRTGILLKRANREQFKCVVEIESEVDFKSRVGRWLGGKPKDDPVLFEPSFKPTNKLMEYDTENLGSFDLGFVEDVTFTTVRGDAVKTST